MQSRGHRDDGASESASGFAGLPKAAATFLGRSPRYLFSSLLKCGACGASYTIRGRPHYACGRHLDGRACSQAIGVKRAIVEPGLLQGIKSELLSEDAVQAAVRAAHRVLNAQKPADTGKRESELRAQIENLTDAIASGALKSTPALASRLATAEKELAALAAHKPAPKAAKLIPQIADEYLAWVSEAGNRHVARRAQPWAGFRPRRCPGPGAAQEAPRRAYHRDGDG